ncbi:hypothetical protein GOBAR_AA29179 [Gossypium barbadense]|uniref:Uncharacterized protein n=1 Tax=Gossypium barbadense TaxID=3634 RepID=A0A2P5WK93_GOSBA|nr:hypothetical protein GOBAR_AA29179 [Gossypium barbadense]
MVFVDEDVPEPADLMPDIGSNRGSRRQPRRAGRGQPDVNEHTTPWVHCPQPLQVIPYLDSELLYFPMQHLSSYKFGVDTS